jgi:hypothetical protein
MQPVSVTAIGAWPGVSPHDAVAVMSDVCNGLWHLPELPERGPGADMIGRTMGMVSAVADDFAVETVPNGWRLTAARGRDMRRADSFLGEDFDAIEEICEGYDGDFKIQFMGPWTLAASVEDRAGERMLRDAGAVRDLTQALRHTIALNVAEVSRRLPFARIVVEIDEPYLVDVLRGSVKTQSKWSAYSPIEAVVVEESLQSVRNVHDGVTILHCCAKEYPFEIVRGAGFTAPSWDVALVGAQAGDHIGEQIDAGGFVVLGIEPVSIQSSIDAIVNLGKRVGYEGAKWNQHIILSPPCDLIDMSLSDARARIETLNKVAEGLLEVGS